MKKFTLLNLLIFFLVLPLSSITQNWAPVGAKWYFTQNHIGTSGVSYRVSESIKDTIILGKNCRKIIQEDVFQTWEVFYTYKSNDSVYFYNSFLNEFKLLYDYGASTGDIWVIPTIPKDPNLYNRLDTVIVHVDSTSQTIIDNQSLRVLYTSMEYPLNSTESPAEFGGEIIENIGGLKFFTPTYAHFFQDPSLGDMRCFVSNDLVFETGAYDCDEVTLSNNEFSLNRLLVFPNPVDDFLILKGNMGYNFNYVIYNTIGSGLGSGIICNDKINVANLSKGIYYIHLVNSSLNVIKIAKFLKL